MKERKLNLKAIELIAYLMIWISVFSVPFFAHRFNNQINWDLVVKEWIRMFSYLIIFLLNIYLFTPQFLLQKRYLAYGFSILTSILLIFLMSITFRDYFFMKQIAMPPMDFGPGMPPMELGAGMAPPIGYRPVGVPVEKSVFMIFLDNFIISVLVVGAGTSIKLISKWLQEEGRRKDSEKEQLKTELAFLRQQVSPHFFMNTLNNIHALIDINAETAKSSLIRLSTLMRYLLYETAHGQTSLKKELDFIESYIALMKLRFSKKVVITMEVPEEVPDIQLPPMLFISFLENSFKHGVSYQHDSFVSFKLEVIQNYLKCIIRNSQHRTRETTDKRHSGIGLTNIKKSLTLLYGDDYSLHIKDYESVFEVTLVVPVQNNKQAITEPIPQS